MPTKKKTAPLDIAEYKVPRGIITTIENEVKKRNADLQAVINNQKSEIIGLRAQVNAMSASVSLNGMSVVQEMFSKMRVENLIEVLRNAVKTTFDYSFDKSSSWDNVPAAFQCHVIFYEERFKVYRFLDEVGIKYPEWMKQVILPHEWGKEYLSLFLDNLRNQYVCNGQTFSGNVHFWYREHKENLVDPALQITKNCSEIPWQFILMNPNWADDELIERISDALQKSGYGSHAEYFLKLPEYNKNLKPEHLIKIASKIEKDDHFKQFFNNELVRNAIFKLGDKELRGRVIKLIEVRDYFPASYQEDYINKLPFEKAIQYIHNNKTFSETEKAALVNNTVKRQYSKEAILDRVLGD